MKRTELLSSFYNGELLPILQRLDKERVGLVIRLVAAFVGIVAFFVGVGVYSWSMQVEAQMLAFLLLPTLVLSVIGFYMLIEGIVKKTSYYSDYKKEVINRLITLINPTLHYDKKNHISHHDYHNSGFFPRLAVDIYGDDHVSGTINEVPIEFSELTVRYQKASDRKDFKSEFQFRGIFFIAERETPYQADLIIEPAKAENPSDVYILPMKNERFNEFFQVRIPNTDYLVQAEAMLTQSFLNKLVLFRKHMHNPIHISFKYNKIYVGIVHDKDLLEPSLMTSVARFDHIQQHFNDLYVPINIIEHFAAHLNAEVIEDEEVEVNQ
jgi:hypothetical protein